MPRLKCGDVMGKRRVRVVAEFEVAEHPEPARYADAMLRDAVQFLVTQERAAGQAYRAQVWAFLRALVAAARVELA